MVVEMWAMVFLLIPHQRSETCEQYVGPVPQEETLFVLVLRLVEVHNSETSVDNHTHMQVVFLPVEVVGEMMGPTAIITRLLKTADPPVNRGWVRQMMARMGKYGAIYLVMYCQAFLVVVVNLVEGSKTRLMVEPTIVMSVKRGMLMMLWVRSTLYVARLESV
jgi:uncharacterized protein YneF (UPF0154 family)